MLLVPSNIPELRETFQIEENKISLACLEEYVVQGQGRGRETIYNLEQIYLPEGKEKIKDLRLSSLIHFVYPKPI